MSNAFVLRSPWRPSGATRWVFGHSPWLSASVIALALLCAADLVIPEGRPPDAAFYGYLLALVVSVGLLHGALWSLSFWFLQRFAVRLAPLFWLAFSVSFATWLARELGAFARLHSRYANLAIAVLATCSAAGVGFGLL